MMPRICVRHDQQLFSIVKLWNLLEPSLFCYRIFFLRLKPEDLYPLLRVVMGASAISANAGKSLLDSETQIALLETQKPFIDGNTLMILSWATFIIFIWCLEEWHQQNPL